MPEGPECHHISDILKQKLEGNFLTKVEILTGRYIRHGVPTGWKYLLDKIPLKIEEIGVKGKFIWWKLGDIDEVEDIDGVVDYDLYLYNTLGMSGQWTTTLDKHCRIAFHLDEDIVYFRDIRNFGTIKIVNNGEEFLEKLSKIGYDILGNGLEKSLVVEVFRKKKNWTLPKFLMNQTYLSGVGNYLKCEALHQCKLSPHLKIEELTDEQLYQVYRAVCQIAKASYQNKGASFQTYRDPDQNKGKYSFQFQIYGKKEVDGYSVVREKTMDGRTTYWSPDYLTNS